MTKLIVKILYQFQHCFKRRETFLWFSIIVFGFLLRSDHRGVSSIIGTLGLNPSCYETMIHFFRSKAYNLKDLKRNWIRLVLDNVEIVKIGEKLLVVVDHIKVAKEARFMPGIKKLHQESENSNKAEYIYGHQLGILMILSIKYPKEVWNKYSGWLRTKTSYYPSPETVQNVLQKELIWNYRKVSNYAIFRKMKQYKNKIYEDLYRLTS